MNGPRVKRASSVLPCGGEKLRRSAKPSHTARSAVAVGDDGVVPDGPRSSAGSRFGRSWRVLSSWLAEAVGAASEDDGDGDAKDSVRAHVSAVAFQGSPAFARVK
ncbi:hypothetical protein ACIGG5_27300 [Streptomyces sp. NPDC085463]|uniref:hypothetical protein n=1 Tax=Streptomyces sp. NPDC085463 TaxID=3365724 RepID=UPI0037D47B58